MIKFKKGDKVRLLRVPLNGIKIGDVCTVDTVYDPYSSLDNYYSFTIEGYPGTYISTCWELVPDPVQDAIKLLQSKGYTVAEPAPRTMEIAVYYYLNNKNQLKVVPKSKFDKWPSSYTLVDVINWTEPK